MIECRLEIFCEDCPVRTDKKEIWETADHERVGGLLVFRVAGLGLFPWMLQHSCHPCLEVVYPQLRC